MQKYYWFLLPFLTAGGIRAHSQSVDSAINALSRTTPATYRQAYQKLGSVLSFSDPQSTATKIGTIHQVSKRLEFKGPAAAAYRMEAVIHSLNRRLPEALQAIAEARRLAINDGLALELADNLEETGILYVELGQPDSALHYYLQAAKLYRERKQVADQARVFYNVGNIFYTMRQYDVSLSYLRDGLRISGDSLRARIRISALNTIALIHRNRKEYPEAIAFHTRSLKLAQTAKDSAWIGINMGNLGRIYELQGKYALALKQYQLNLEYSRKFKIWGNAVITLSRIAQLHLSSRNNTAAQRALEEARQLAVREKEYDDLVQVYNSYTQYYRQVGQYDSAFRYQELYYQGKDSLERQYFNTQIEQIRATYEFDKNQAEIELLKKNNAAIRASEQKKNVWLLTASCLLLCTTLFGFLLYRNNRQKHRANQLLTAQQKELFELNEEINRQNEEITDLNNNLERLVEERTQDLQIAHDNLMKQNQNLEQFAFIISHNLRAPIAQIMGLVSLFDQDQPQKVPDPKVLQYLDKAARNMDTVVNDLNDILMMRHQADAVREEVHLEAATQSVLDSLATAIANTEAKVRIDFSEVPVVIAIRSYVTSILYNLIANAIKYRHPERSPIISLKTNRTEGYVCLSVRDNGLGMDFSQVNPNKIFKLYHRMHLHTEGKGMGLFIVKEQVEAMNGRIEVESQPDEGATFRVCLPV